jgi:glycerol kinase
MSAGELILAIDQGTTNTKAVLVDADGSVRHRVSRRVHPTFPQPGWVEHNPDHIWGSVQQAMDACLTEAGDPRISCIAISNQRESVLMWDRWTGRPCGPLIVWQCRRTSRFCEGLRNRGVETMVRERTGLPIDALFSASKIRWLLDNIPDGRARAECGELCAGTVDSWLIWNLTGSAIHGCDVSNASRTQLLSLQSGAWDPKMLALFKIPETVLPSVKPSAAHFGETKASGRLPAGVPITGVIGDSHGALFGQGGFEPGVVKATYGTGSSLMSPISRVVLPENGLAATVAWQICDEIMYALEGNISVTGAAVDWCTNLLGLDDAPETAALANQVDSTDGVFLVPAFVGLGAPYWQEQARGLITGITRGTTRAHVARAAIESIAFQIRDVFDAMAPQVGTDVTALLADGGASRNDTLMQFQADLLGCPVLRNKAEDLSALGAAYIAGLSMGIWQSTDDLAKLPRSFDRFEPMWSDAKRSDVYSGWKEAVARTINNPKVKHESPDARMEGPQERAFSG